MEREIIERLAIDCALGELNEDTATLFDAYCAEHPEAQRWAEQTSQTCTRTRKAIDKKTRRAAGEGHSHKPRRHWLVQVNWAVLARWAAVIVISLGIGAGLTRWSGPRVSKSNDIVVQAGPVAAQKGWERVLGEPGQGFWQAKAVALLRPRPYVALGVNKADVRLWDGYRHYTKKERYHE